VKTYKFHRGEIFQIGSTVMLALMSALLICMPIAQSIARRPVEYEIFWILPVIAFFWYVRLKPVTSVVISDQEITFVSPVGRRSLSYNSIKSIRPMFNTSSRDFVLMHQDGHELLFEDPTTVGLIAQEIRSRNPAVKLRGMPEVPAP
jgi:hypothetical protein